MDESQVVLGSVETSYGSFGVLIGPQGLARLTFPGEGLEPCRAWAARWWPGCRVRERGARDGGGSVAAVEEQLRAYFAGTLRVFTVPLDLRGTEFQLSVWEALRGVPYGQTVSYAALAAAIGRPRAVRAVGRANGANPVPIVVPCHRVIGSDGGLVGFGGGLGLKRSLLSLERTWHECLARHA